MQFNNKAYDILKWVAMVVLPAFVAFFKVVGIELGFEYTDTIANILVAFNAFLGAILGVSTANYNKDNK